MRRHVIGVWIALSILFAGTGVQAATGGDADDESSPSKYVTFTISTLNLAKPVLSDETVDYGPEFQVMGEANIVDMFGVAGIFTYGHATGKRLESSGDKLSDPFELNVYRVGLQGLWYPVGDFSTGMQLGLQGMYAWGSTEADVETVNVQASVGASSVAAVIGYKAMIEPGFTFVGQLGGGPRFIRATGKGEVAGAERTAERSEIAPKIIININLGWTF